MSDATDNGSTLSVFTPDGAHQLDPGAEYVVGRGADADIGLTDLRVSRRHACLRHESDDGWIVEDLDSQGGTWADGVAVGHRRIGGWLDLCLGDPVTGPCIKLRTSADTLTVGRAPDNDVVVDDLLVSRRHAVVRRMGDDFELEDLGSANGTFVGGVAVARAPLAEGQTFAVGHHLLRMRQGQLVPVSEGDVPALDCLDVGMVINDGLRILGSVSLRARQGTVTAVLGPTGAGKSTLLQVLTGARSPSAGRVLVSGRDLHAAPDLIRPLVGYVPQEDIIHPQLTVRQALRFAAALRLPPDVTAAEVAGRIDVVLDELGLTERADVRVQHLSGGQRKRTSVAVELLTAPEVLVLDEPTSGLDPGYEQSVMQLLRHLADAGHTVVVVTHSVQSLELCDQLLLLAPGGRPAYLGPPDALLTAFGCENHAAVFHALERGEYSVDPPRLPTDPQVIDDSPADHAGPPDLRNPHDRQRWAWQVRTLARRQVAVLAGDRRVATFLVAAVLVPAGLLLIVVEAGALSPSDGRPASQARTLLGALVITAMTLGFANAVREIVKERAIAARDRSAGVADTAYLASKLAVFGGVTALQVLLLVAITLSTADGPRGSSTWLPGWLEILIAVTITAWAAVALGLLLSSLVSSSEKAMALVSMMFVAQWLLSGVALDLAETPVIRPVSYLTSANWGMAAVASTADLATLEGGCGAGPSPSERSSPAPTVGVENAGTQREATERPCDARWGRGPWRWLGDVVALVALTVAPLPGVLIRLRRSDP